MRRLSCTQNTTYIYIFAEFLIYVGFIFLDINHVLPFLSKLLKFSGILLCFPMIPRNNLWIKYAFLFTIISDFFLVMTDLYIIGIICFILVQLFYYLFLNDGKNILAHYIIIAVISYILWQIFHLFLHTPDLLVFLSIAYFLSLISNISDCFFLGFRKDNNFYKLMFCSLILVSLCDIHVGITNIYSYISTTNTFLSLWHNFAIISMWIFYLPSQVILVTDLRNIHGQ